ncbi:uncharacterized protein dtx3lb.2 isoform X6 [Denticeps clupeoides]|uniref:uncharacterized protein dtx3lb.2 isoform X6 n=1 Tax=Denticeps clupeoides TaxID=299321 RepID=UPI0010A5143F|nr:uncharacterized protein LOC114800728 isoform X6 [Denticeps clupeoides]
MKLNSQSHPEVCHSATFYVIVKGCEGISEVRLTNALQSWINKEIGNHTEITDLQLNDDVGTVKVTPAEVLETILSKNTAEIKKRETSATVEFCRHHPKAVTAVANFAGSALSQEAVLPTQSHPEVRNFATFYVIVRGGEGISEAKFRKALQSWINKEIGNQAEIEELQLNDDVGTVKVTPAEVLETILSKNTAEIKKRETSATVEFCRHRPKAVIAVANFAGSALSQEAVLPTQSHPEVRNFATFYVIVRRGEGISEAKFRKALQSWINKEIGNQAEIAELQLNDDVGTVKVTPAEVLETILSKNTAEIKKRETSATVEFCRHRPKAVRAVANFAGSALSQEPVLPTQVEEADVLPRCVTKMETSDTMKVPLVQYWYLNQVYRDEMKQIQEKHDVDIDAEVSVSIKTKKGTSSRSLNDADLEIVDLFQKSTKNLISCPSDTIYRNLSQLIEVLKTTPDAARLMFNVASEHLEVFGPEEHINTVQKMLGVQPHSHAAGFEKQERSRTMEIDISRSFLNKGLSMNQTHWDLMQSGYKKQVEDIEEKFGVVFKTETKGGTVKVKAMSNKGQVV